MPQPALPPSLQFIQERTGEAKQDSSAQAEAGQAPTEQILTGQTPAGETASAGSTPQAEVARYGPLEVSTEWGRSLGKGKRFGNEDFRIVDEKTVVD